MCGKWFSSVCNVLDPEKEPICGHRRDILYMTPKQLAALRKKPAVNICQGKGGKCLRIAIMVCKNKDCYMDGCEECGTTCTGCKVCFDCGCPLRLTLSKKRIGFLAFYQPRCDRCLVDFEAQARGHIISKPASIRTPQGLTFQKVD